jgi:hypothetical protein
LLMRRYVKSFERSINGGRPARNYREKKGVAKLLREFGCLIVIHYTNTQTN